MSCIVYERYSIQPGEFYPFGDGMSFIFIFLEANKAIDKSMKDSQLSVTITANNQRNRDK